MYKNEFDKLEKIPNYFMFYGDKFYLNLYEEMILHKFKDSNILKMYFDEYDYDLAKRHVSESSLFNESSVLIIKHNKLPNNIENLLKSVSRNNYLFFFYYGDKKIDIFKKNFVRFFEPTLKEKIEYVNKLADNLNITITKEAINFLVNSIEPIFIKKELEKLSIYSNEINLDIVKNLVFIYKDETFEELFVSILKGEDFFDKLNTLIEVVDFKRVLPALIKYIKDLYMYNLYIKKTGNSSLKGYLGYQLPFNIEKERIALCMKFKEKDYFELLYNLLNFEFKMRNSDKNKEAVFFEAMSYLRNFNSF